MLATGAVEGSCQLNLDEAHHIVARHESLFGKLDPSLENIGRRELSVPKYRIDAPLDMSAMGH